MNGSKTKKLVESAIMIALATVLSIIKVIDMPYGGSVTLASSLPIVIIAYRHGLGWGLSSGIVYGILQQLLGLSTLSYVTGWQSVIAVILLDYVVAYAVFGLSGVFSKIAKNQHTGMVLGALLTSFLRYACHVISGVTVWREISIPASAAFTYSLIYNATYMIPDTCVLLVAVYYIGRLIDFSRPQPTRMVLEKAENRNTGYYVGISSALFVAAVIADVVMIFPYLQDEESGVFTLANLSEVNWVAFALINAVCIIGAVALLVISRVQHSEEN
ncbi:MAG: energy-coupled thiamine transporter ThiT [Clostridia bacterium]|nr:energy-coupled thiamine transporter ThiT [Clostridia bacterium]